MIGRNRSLVGAEKPPLQQAGDSMHTRQRDVSRVRGRRQRRGLVKVAVFGQRVVATPTVGEHDGGRTRLVVADSSTNSRCVLGCLAGAALGVAVVVLTTTSWGWRS